MLSEQTVRAATRRQRHRYANGVQRVWVLGLAIVSLIVAPAVAGAGVREFVSAWHKPRPRAAPKHSPTFGYYPTAWRPWTGCGVYSDDWRFGPAGPPTQTGPTFRSESPSRQAPIVPEPAPASAPPWSGESAHPALPPEPAPPESAVGISQSNATALPSLLWNVTDTGPPQWHGESQGAQSGPVQLLLPVFAQPVQQEMRR